MNLSSEIAIALSMILISSAAAALFSKSVSISLIMLFYASLLLGVTFTLYGSALVGVLEIITFAGAISVMLLSAILMTGESKLDIGGSKLKLMLVLTFIGLATTGAFFLLVQTPSGTATEIGGNLTTTDLFSFIWTFRPWDLLILLIVFSSAMVVVANLFSRETT